MGALSRRKQHQLVEAAQKKAKQTEARPGPIRRQPSHPPVIVGNRWPSRGAHTLHAIGPWPDKHSAPLPGYLPGDRWPQRGTLARQMNSAYQLPVLRMRWHKPQKD